jgi:putative sterol carrier protein
LSTFLGEEHMTTGTEALNADAGFQGAMTGVDLNLQFEVTDAPAGPIAYYISVGDGAATLALGTLEDSDASVASDYETAAAIAKGELNVQMAFMTGKIKVGGNMAKVMMYQSLINEFARVTSTLDLEF